MEQIGGAVIEIEVKENIRLRDILPIYYLPEKIFQYLPP